MVLHENKQTPENTLLTVKLYVLLAVKATFHGAPRTVEASPVVPCPGEPANGEKVAGPAQLPTPDETS